MAIENKTCLCGCGRTFYGTARRKFYDPKCKAKWHREQKKNAEPTNDNGDLPGAAKGS